MALIIAAAQIAAVPGDVSANLRTHARFAVLAAERGAQLLVFPELSLTGYELALARANAVAPDDPRLDALRQLAARARMTMAVGAPVPDGEGSLSIGAIVLGADGGCSSYTKIHVHESEMGVFAAGAGGAPLRVGEAAVGLAICRDASFPEHAADAASRGVDVYAAGVMIDDEGYAKKAPLLRGYARRHRMAVLMANYAGVTGGMASAGRSAVWTEDGEVVAACEGPEEALLVAAKEGGAWRGSVTGVGPQR